MNIPLCVVKGGKCGRVGTGTGVYKREAYRNRTTSAVNLQTQKCTHAQTMVLRVNSTRRDTESHQSALFLPLSVERNTDRLTDCFSLTSDFTAGPTSLLSRWNSAWWPRSAATDGRECVRLETPTSCMIKKHPLYTRPQFVEPCSPSLCFCRRISDPL